MQDIKRIKRKQEEFFATGQTDDITFRIENLELLKKIIKQNEKAIINSLKEDLGKHPVESYVTEIGIVLKEISLFLKNIKKWSQPEKVKTSLLHFRSSSYIYQEPYGNVLIFAPWNYPFQLSLLPLVGAIGAGNTVILKPSEYASTVSSVIFDLIENNFPEEFIKVILGKEKVSKFLLTQNFDYIFFTGSKRIGKKVMKAAADNLIPVTLELGGKSPCIVNDDARIDLAAKRIVWGKFLNAGQTCVAPDYLLLNKKIKKEFIEKTKKYISQFFGPDLEMSEDYAKIINEKHFERLKSYLKSGEIVSGGVTNKEKLYISPTIIDEISFDDAVMEEEIFGPILPVIEFNNQSDIIEQIKMKPDPLALYIFSESKQFQDYILKRIKAGGCTINDTVIHVSSPYLPFGGIGESGMGNYHGKYSFDTFSHKKSVIKKTTLFDLPFRYPPYKGKLKWVKKLFGLIN